ncbi:MarR family transcriptional regulator [Rhodococcus sp. HNM0569]|uniref:MarR family winged helix-turn-helix transcriptional regulator n=1 Tax=Rhodococcus sp. HNM0569 TaxID=2716340 RepID=UPI00146B420C|nr:MarR family transcriptional regulator [Rhodococcus sp. HNM0569]NLU82294.1 winged helix DNA-binding protein [Rhodococcus sp. HNM0569]
MSDACADTAHAPGTETLRDLVLGTARTLRRRWVSTLQPWQLSPHEFRALRVVEHDERPRLSAVARALHIAPRSATEVIDRLEERGLTERVPDEFDRRATCVRTTADGRRVLDELRSARDADSDEFFAGITDAERAELRRILTKLHGGAS